MEQKIRALILSQETEVVIVAGRSSETEIYVNDQKLEYAVSPTEEVLQNITIHYVKRFNSHHVAGDYFSHMT